MQLKTRILSQVDLHSYVEKLEPGLVMTPEQIEEAVQMKIEKEYLVLEPLAAGDTIRAGDSVTIRTESELPRFQKKRVPVTVGRGLYDATLEAALIGHCQGDCVMVETRGVSVRATVLEAKRKGSIPQVTDEMAAGLGIPEVTTVEELRSYIDTYGDQLGSYVFQTMIPQMAEDAVYTPIEESDCSFVRELLAQHYEGMYQDYLNYKGLTPETISEQEKREFLGGFDSPQEHAEHTPAENCERWIRTVLLLSQLLHRDWEAADAPALTYGSLFELSMQLIEQVEQEVRGRRE